VTAVVVEAAEGVGLDGLEPALLDAFKRLRAAVLAGRPAVVVVRERDLLAHGDEFDAALAHGVIGLVRALAIEGAKPGWTINALAVAEDTGAEERARWLERLAEPAGASGTVVRLGAGHLGKLAV
jgi:hypothetical protein